MIHHFGTALVIETALDGSSEGTVSFSADNRLEGIRKDLAAIIFEFPFTSKLSRTFVVVALPYRGRCHFRGNFFRNDHRNIQNASAANGGWIALNVFGIEWRGLSSVKYHGRSVDRMKFDEGFEA
jgi:hypothetical protein